MMDTQTTPAEIAGIAGPEVDVPSCQGCRRRKLKCSREQPTCAHCSQSPCIYDLKRNKPGIKPGAVGSLSRRVEVLENTLLKHTERGACGCTQGGHHPAEPTDEAPNVLGVLSLLAQELHKLNAQTPIVEATVLSPSVSQGSSRIAVDGHAFSAESPGRPRKRRRVDSCGNPTIELTFALEDLENITTNLPPPALLEDVINAYFCLIQPWIPMIHETQFRARIHDPGQIPGLVVVLHAMVVAALRFVDSAGMGLPQAELKTRATRSRNIVMLTAMDHLSVENLQALIIVAFNDIGHGDSAKAWSVIGSLTRTVEYAQLSVESDLDGKEPLLKPLTTIPAPDNWTEEEQRRRVFWNVFCLDRLPADGGLWHKEEPVTTPYFGIWDRSAAKIGKSIAFLPGHSTEPASETPLASSNTGVSSGPNTVDMTTVGAFAYCIEAIESLSRVTTYFLQQKIDFQDRQEVSSWLTRFKELDLRLVHWKMFLPQKWKDSNISRQPALINMDPNLTLAHVTHNTSMILLHQRIAYPDNRWSNIVKLPSFCSAETCQVAASETATITQKYLRYTPQNSPVTSQFAFCVFVSARVLLSRSLVPLCPTKAKWSVHWRHYDADLSPEFWVLVQNLEEMARRWMGHLREQPLPCLAGKYALQLRDLHARCQTNPDTTFDVLGYSDGTLGQTPVTATGADPAVSTQAAQDVSPAYNSLLPGESLEPSEQGVSFAMPRFQDLAAVGSAKTPKPPGPSGLTPQGPEGQPDELSTISHMLMDQRFLDMDRVISFDDMMFTAQTASPRPAALVWGAISSQM
ncbi:hypothetical protein BN1723_015824 [Verticillium longisporum]|uniref:Zn(2)-C6 fungal-type domain-containing protein n=1 Tax=Verticillium longisporum TaxID=100787 RepID=A0A0G4N2Z1_VERLO|nr:hypothetical protein BN1723_015824 [Verticillium longisporum]